MAEKTPSQSLAEKLASLDLDENEAKALNRILQRAEGGDARDVEVEGFGFRELTPLMSTGMPVVSPERLRRAIGVTSAWECEDEPTLMCMLN